MSYKLPTPWPLNFAMGRPSPPASSQRIRPRTSRCSRFKYVPRGIAAAALGDSNRVEVGDQVFGRRDSVRHEPHANRRARERTTQRADRESVRDARRAFSNRCGTQCGQLWRTDVQPCRRGHRHRKHDRIPVRRLGWARFRRYVERGAALCDRRAVDLVRRSGIPADGRGRARVQRARGGRDCSSSMSRRIRRHSVWASAQASYPQWSAPKPS